MTVAWNSLQGSQKIGMAKQINLQKRSLVVMKFAGPDPTNPLSDLNSTKYTNLSFLVESILLDALKIMVLNQLMLLDIVWEK